MTAILHASTDRHHEWGGEKRYVRIYIHKTVEEFQMYAGFIRDDAVMINAVGAFHSPPQREFYDETLEKWINKTDRHWAGVIRLNEEWLNDEVLAHECAHAAASIFRMDVSPSLDLGLDCGPGEERFCYILGNLTESVFKVVRQWQASRDQ